MLELQNVHALPCGQFVQFPVPFPVHLPLILGSDQGCSCGTPSTAGMRLTWRAMSSTSGSCGIIAAAGLALAAGWSCCCCINTKGSWEVAEAQESSSIQIKSGPTGSFSANFFWGHQICPSLGVILNPTSCITAS